MPDNSNSDILIRALEASGSEREAKLARAILGKAEAPAEPTAAERPAASAAQPRPAPQVGTPNNPGLPTADVSPPAIGPQPPAGKAPLQNLNDVERLPLEEQIARMAEIDALIESGEK